MAINKPIYKWVLGSVLVATYLGFFVWQEIVQMGVLPLIIVTLGWCWVFYKATGINLGSFSSQENKGNKAAD